MCGHSCGNVPRKRIKGDNMSVMSADGKIYQPGDLVRWHGKPALILAEGMELINESRQSS